MIDKITQNISPVTPLPGLLVENRPAAVNQLVEEELPLLSTQLETLVGQLNTTISQTNIAVDIAANAAVVSNSLSNYVGEWSTLVSYDKNQTTSIGTLYYISKVDDNLNHIVTDTNYWMPNPVNTKIDYNMSGYTEKVTPVNTDLFPLSDSAATFGIKKLTWANIKVTIISSFGVMISTLTAKTTPVDADIFTIGDSEATNASKKLTWANIKATLKTYFDTLYLIASTETAAGIIELATTAEAQDGTDSVRAITPLQLFNSLKGSSQSLAKNGYQKLHGGLIIQWGNSSSGEGTATFPIAFSNRCFNVQVSFYENSGTTTFGSGYMSANSITKTGFSYGFVGTVARQWLAVGY